MKSLRKIIRIDAERCNGCGLCVPSCAEGAIQIVDGKARLVADKYCDGLGACLGDCPLGALTIEEREADEFVGPVPGLEGHHPAPETALAAAPFVCPGSLARQFEPTAAAEAGPSALSHWPVKLRLINPQAPFLKGAELLVAADCAPFAAGDFHANLLQGKVVLCGCPKFDDMDEHVAKLTAIIRENDVRGVTIANLEVPCCFGLVQLVRAALTAAGKNLPVTIVTLGTRGNVVQQQKIKAA
jgi:Pyruvate/2-oxoacid:ferredoxin oxidoreductase delta subunit